VNKVLGWLLIPALMVVLGCDLSSPATPAPLPDVSTVVAATLQAMQGSANPGSVTYGNVSLTIPPGLATDALTGTVPALTDTQQWSPWDLAPAHVTVLLDHYSVGYSLQQPEIFIYPAADFASSSDMVKANITRLQAMHAQAMPLTAQNMPLIPFFNAAQVFAAHMKSVTFRNGSGVRLVTQYDSGVTPVDNQSLFYHFQGLTGDGKYYIIAVLPTSADFLPADSSQYTISSPTALDFPGFYNPNAGADEYNKYFKAVTDKLNATADGDFKPSLATLDALIGSLLIKP
jgi:hypothetical protein